MKIISLEQKAQQDPDLGLTNPGLTSHLKRTDLGSAPTPRSWLYEDVAPETVTNHVLDMLKDASEPLVEIYTDDLSNADKIGPQGGLKPWTEERKGLLDMSYEQGTPSPVFSTPLWQEAKRNVIAELKFKRNLRPKAPDSVINSIRKTGGLATNSGLPEFTRRSNVIQETLQQVNSGKWIDFPAVIGSRSMRQAERNIFMFPFSTNVNGSTYQQVVQDHIRNLKLDSYAAWEGFEKVEQVIQQAMDKKYYKLSGDFSKMDNHFKVHHMKEVYDVVKEAFQPKYWDGLEASMLHTNTIDVVTPDGYVTGDHGVASGSEWTNFSETLFQHILWEYIKLLRNRDGKAPITLVLFLGDDVIAFSLEPMVDDFVDASISIGFVSNREKNYESTTKVHYLRRWFYTDYKSKTDLNLGVYPLTLNINSIVYPERFHDPKKWNGQMFTLRTLMILENAINHPLFVPYATYVLKGNTKHFAEFAKLPPRSVARAEAEAREIAGFVPSYNQEKIDKPLSEYESYKLLRTIYS